MQVPNNENEAICLWNIVIDKSSASIYTVDSFDEVINRVDGALYQFLDDNTMSDLLSKVEEKADLAFIPIHITDDRGIDHTVDIIRTDLDGKDKVSILLKRILGEVDVLKYPELTVDILELWDRVS